MSTPIVPLPSTNISPYDAIKARAITLLRDGNINSRLVGGLKLESRWCFRNQISIAIIMARDELLRPLPLKMRFAHYRRSKVLNKKDHARMIGELVKEFTAGLHDKDEPKFSAFMRDASWPVFIVSNDHLYRVTRTRGESGDGTDKRWADFLDWRREQLKLSRQFDSEVAS
jgi:hypothetical protein